MEVAAVCSHVLGGSSAASAGRLCHAGLTVQLRGGHRCMGAWGHRCISFKSRSG